MLQANQGKNFHQKLTISDDSKMSIHLCNVFLGLSSSGSQLGRVKHVKFDHVLDTIFCWFWAESVQCVLHYFLRKQPTMSELCTSCNLSCAEKRRSRGEQRWQTH